MSVKYHSKLWCLGHSQSKDVYLFGTIHLPIDKLNWDQANVMKSLELVEVYAGEMDLAEASNQQDKGYNLIPQGQAINDLLGQKLFSKIRKSLLQAFHVDINEYRYLRPLLLQQIIDQKIVGGNNAVLDQYIWDQAIAKGKKCVGLESFCDQVRILESIEISFQLSNLRKMAAKTSSHRRKLLMNVKRYNENNIPALYKSSRASLGAYKKLLIDDRNINMVDRIIELSGEASLMAGVGAGHLYGNMGLLALLKRRGYKLEPV